MTSPETLPEALALIAILQKARESAIDAREEARAQLRATAKGFAERADLWRDSVRTAKKCIDGLADYIAHECPKGGPMRNATIDTATNVSLMLERVLSR